MIRRPALAAALVSFAGLALAAPPPVETIMLGTIDITPEHFPGSVSAICFRNEVCSDVQWQARGALIDAYRGANTRRQATIESAVAAATHDGQTNWQMAATDASVDIVAGAPPPAPPRGIYCHSHVSRNGRDVSAYCN